MIIFSILNFDWIKNLEKLVWKSIDESIKLPLIPDNLKQFFGQYDFCVTGDSLNMLLDSAPSFLIELLPKIKVWARVAPKQKEFIITSLRSLGYVTLMCGDGTNDVGALKHSDVGVALLSNPLPTNQPKSSTNSTDSSTSNSTVEKVNQNGDNRTNVNDNNIMERMSKNNIRPRRTIQPITNNAKLIKTQERIDKLLKDLEEQDQPQIIKLGDASIAAPFTSKLSSIRCSN